MQLEALLEKIWGTFEKEKYFAEINMVKILLLIWEQRLLSAADFCVICLLTYHGLQIIDYFRFVKLTEVN